MQTRSSHGRESGEVSRLFQDDRVLMVLLWCGMEQGENLPDQEPALEIPNRELYGASIRGSIKVWNLNEHCLFCICFSCFFADDTAASLPDQVHDFLISFSIRVDLSDHLAEPCLSLPKGLRADQTVTGELDEPELPVSVWLAGTPYWFAWHTLRKAPPGINCGL